MNKEQKRFLLAELERNRSKKLRDFESAHPTQPTEAEIRTKLKAAGFLVNEMRDYAVSYCLLPQTALHKKNEAAIEALANRLASLFHEARMAVELGDNRDALALLKEFNQKIEKL